jgi:hypothetical protein
MACTLPLSFPNIQLAILRDATTRIQRHSSARGASARSETLNSGPTNVPVGGLSIDDLAARSAGPASIWAWRKDTSLSSKILLARHGNAVAAGKRFFLLPFCSTMQLYRTSPANLSSPPEAKHTLKAGKTLLKAFYFGHSTDRLRPLTPLSFSPPTKATAALALSFI